MPTISRVQALSLSIITTCAPMLACTAMYVRKNASNSHGHSACNMLAIWPLPHTHPVHTSCTLYISAPHPTTHVVHMAHKSAQLPSRLLRPYHATHFQHAISVRIDTLVLRLILHNVSVLLACAPLCARPTMRSAHNGPRTYASCQTLLHHSVRWPQWPLPM